MTSSVLPDTYAMPVILAEPSFIEEAWDRLQAEIDTPSGDGFLATVNFVEEPELEGRNEPQLVAAFPRRYPEYPHAAAVIADRTTFDSQDLPLLVVSLNPRDRSTSFRIRARDLHAFENNISIGNMDFDEFAEHLDATGLFQPF